MCSCCGFRFDTHPLILTSTGCARTGMGLTLTDEMSAVLE